MRRFLDRLYDASGALAAVCLAGICVLMLAQAGGREFGLLIRGADDITAWLCAAAAFLALGHTFRHGELVRVGLWIDMLGPELRRYAELLALTLTHPKVTTLPVLLNKFQSAVEGRLYGPQAAIGTVITIPVVVLGILIQKHLVKGFSFGMIRK